MTLSFEQFWKEQAEWSRKTFGSDEGRGPVGPLKHLALETVVELLGYEEGDFRRFLATPTRHPVDAQCIELRARAKKAAAAGGYIDERVQFTFEDSKKVCLEFADLLFLVVDAARRAGMTPAMLLTSCFAKLAVNKSRQWGEPTKDGAVEHVREVGGEG